MTDHTGPEASRDSIVDGADTAGSDPGNSPAGVDDTPAVESPSPPPSVEAVFGDRTELATSYVDFLSTAGLERGLMGPRERPRLWDRHVLNCAAGASHLNDGE